VRDVFDCPANPGNEVFANCLIPGTTFYVDYEINGFLAHLVGSSNRRQSRITDYSVAAYSYDYPYDPNADSDPDHLRQRAHVGGINVAYLDGHAAWLLDEEMGSILTPGDDGSEFYAKGHDLWAY
jgi:prepilin-type processing-associated H-X9-DG protein